MTDLRERQTGDSTYLNRVERWEYIQRRLAETPKPTYEQIGADLGLSKQNIARYVKRGTVRPSGRQPSNEGRRRRVLARLTLWNSRRLAKMAQRLDVAFEEGWIVKLETELRALA